MMEHLRVNVTVQLPSHLPEKTLPLRPLYIFHNDHAQLDLLIDYSDGDRLTFRVEDVEQVSPGQRPMWYERIHEGSHRKICQRMEAVNRRASGSPPVLAVGLELAHSLAQPCVLYDSLFLGFFHFKFVLRFVKTLQLLRPILPVVDSFSESGSPTTTSGDTFGRCEL
jgi:hypothetical protein